MTTMFVKQVIFIFYFFLITNPLGGSDGGNDNGKGGRGVIFFCNKKNAISPFFVASRNKNIGATVRIG